MGLKWEPVRIDEAGELDDSEEDGILRDELYRCAFCRGGEKPRGLKCPVCKGKTVVSVTPPAVVCAYCKGRGEDRSTPNITCLACGGKGIVSIKEPIETCPVCGGSGLPRGSSLYCFECRGKGVVSV